MNNKGQTLGLAIMASLFLILIGFMSINFLMPEIIDFRTNMDCASASQISDGVKLMCLMTDATIPYWVVLIVSTAIGGITARLLL